MAKSTREDTPLAASPDPGERKNYTRKEYKSELKQARREHNIEAARAGTLDDERIKKVSKVANTVADVVNTATGVGAVTGLIKGSRGGGGRRSSGEGYDN